MHVIGRGRYAREAYPETPRQGQFGVGAAATVQQGGSAANTVVTLDSAPFSLPAGMTRVMVIAFMAVQPTTAGEQIEYALLFDGSDVLPSGGGGSGTLESFGQTGTVVGQLSTNGSLSTIITPGDNAPHTYSIRASSAHNLQIGDGTASVVLLPLS